MVESSNFTWRFSYFLSVIILLLFLPISTFYGTQGFIPDALIFIGILTLLYFSASTWRLNVPTFIMITVAFVLHMLGIFGFYGTSPVPIQWDHITHGYGLIPFTLLLANFIFQFASKKRISIRNIVLLTLVVMSASGIGSTIELFEFTGYLAFGTGEGALQFGAGDGLPGDTDAIKALGGGWINMGWDLIYNTLGIFLGLLIYLTQSFIFRKS